MNNKTKLARKRAKWFVKSFWLIALTKQRTRRTRHQEVMTLKMLREGAKRLIAAYHAEVRARARGRAF